MTSEQALEVIRQATEQFRGTRKDHEFIAEAMRVLTALVQKSKEADAGE